MKPIETPGSVDWASVAFVVFDVDGTLYDQGRLRRRMLVDLLAHAVKARSLAFLLVLRHYRHLREELGDDETPDFEEVLLERTAAAAHCSRAFVVATVAEWIETRPLRHLAGCVYPGVVPLFDALRRHGKKVGVWSDYPAQAKLRALGLTADHVLHAGDPGVGLLKPSPLGLITLLERAGMSAEATLMIGDRAERDGMAARRLGVRVLLRARPAIPGWPCFGVYDDPVFAAVLGK